MDKKDLYPFMYPTPNRIMHNSVVGILNAMQPIVNLWTDYEIKEQEKFSDFIDEHDINTYSCLGISNHIGEIETFYVPLAFINAIREKYGYKGAYDYTFHILAKEGLYGERDVKQITLDRLVNQRCNAFGKFIQSLGALKYFRYARSVDGVPEDEKLYAHDQMDIIIEEIIDKNKNLTIFPQGHRQNGKSLKAGPLMTYLALFSNAPVVIAPIHIEGDFRLNDMKERKQGIMRFTFREPYFINKEEISDRLEVNPNKVKDRELFIKANYKRLSEESKNFVQTIYGL